MNADQTPRPGELADARPGSPQAPPSEEPTGGSGICSARVNRRPCRHSARPACSGPGTPSARKGRAGNGRARAHRRLGEDHGDYQEAPRDRSWRCAAPETSSASWPETLPGYRTATVVAIGPVRALVVTYDRFSQFLDSNPGAGRAYRHVMTQRWRETADMLRSRSVNNGAQRLAGLLLDLAARHGNLPPAPATAITIPLSQEEIASLIGTSRATVTRALGDWRRRGLISTARHQITIKSTPGLRSIADRDTDSHAPLPGR